MRKFLFGLILGVGLSLSTASAMTHSVTNAKLDFQNDEHAIVSFTFNNKTDGYHAEMYYIPRLAVYKNYDEESFSFLEDYMFFEPVSFSIGANESKELKYDCTFPKGLAIGSYSISIDFYERTNKISDYSTDIMLRPIETPLQSARYSIDDVLEECIVVDGQAYGAASGPTVKKDSKIQAQLNLKLNAEKNKRVMPKITVYNRTMLGGVISSSYGQSFELNANEEQQVFIDLPYINIPESYLIHVALVDENSSQISKTYEFRYVVKGATANVTYLEVSKDLDVTVGVVGPADASVLMNAKIYCNVYDSDYVLLKTLEETRSLGVIEKKIKFSLKEISFTNDKAIVEINVVFDGKIIATKKNELEINKIDNTAEIFSDVKGTKYEEAVTLLNSLGIINGYPDGTFKPTNSITRGEFTTIAIKLAGLDLIKSQETFSDCTNHWSKQYVDTAAKNSILSGYPDGTFRPDNLVTYSEGVTILLNMKGYKNEISQTGFSWPYNYLNKAKDVGLFESIETESYLLPANRGDVAIMALNAYLMSR